MDNHVKTLALIPARGGSKAIPRKNLLPINGVPLVVHSIQHALAAHKVDRVIVSTDDREISSVASANGVEVVMRPKELGGDTASSESALLHALNWVEQDGYAPDLVVFLQPTSPIRPAGCIDAAIETLLEQSADSLFSAFALHGLLWRREGGGLKSISYDYIARQRRQELAEEIVENGSLYIFKPWVLKEGNNRLGGKIAVYLMDLSESLQVDTPEDLETLQKLMPLLNTNLDTPALAHVKGIAMDFDGVMTDNRVIVNDRGEESVSANRADGWGVARLKEAGFALIVLSTEANPVVEARCQKLGIESLQNLSDKLTALRSWAEDKDLAAKEVAFIGNDVNDLDCLSWVGVPIVVADADPLAKKAARFITTADGGRGAVREVADWLLRARSHG